MALDPDALPTRERPSMLAHAVEALVAAAVATRRRLGGPTVDVWAQIAVLTRGRLPAPSPAG